MRGFRRMRQCAICLEDYPKRDGVSGQPYNVEGAVCPECVVMFSSDGMNGNSATHDEDEEWYSTMYGPYTPPTKESTGSIMAGAPAPKAYKFVPPATTTKFTPMPVCSHHLQPLEIASGRKIYLSASRDIKKLAKGPTPDAGVYLAQGWINDRILTNDDTDLRTAGAMRIMYLEWMDYGGVDMMRFAQALKWARERLFAGEVLEVGCMGGHGRTGTFAAAMAVVLGKGGQEAIDFVRKEYCDRAIESDAQEDLVLEVRYIMHPEERPATPIVRAKKVFKGYTPAAGVQVYKGGSLANGDSD